MVSGRAEGAGAKPGDLLTQPIRPLHLCPKVPLHAGSITRHMFCKKYLCFYHEADPRIERQPVRTVHVPCLPGMCGIHSISSGSFDSDSKRIYWAAAHGRGSSEEKWAGH